MVQNSFTGVSNFIDGCIGEEEIKAVMEATGNWDLMYDWLENNVPVVGLCACVEGLLKLITLEKVRGDILLL